jgi:general stress protein CsbA
MRIFNLFFFIVFLLFAAVQYNDPDPYVWIPIYGYGAVLCFLAFRKKYYPSAYLLGIIVYAAYAGFKLLEPDGVWDWITKHHAQNIADSMKATTPWVEETREFFGLVIVIGVLLIDYLYARRTSLKRMG